MWPRVLDERQDEKVIHSKALLLAETPPPAAGQGPSPRDKAAAFIVPEAVLLTNDEDNDFQVTFGFGLWCHDTDSSCGLCKISEPRPPLDRCWRTDGSLLSRFRVVQ